MTKDTTMPKPDTGVYRRSGSTRWQWRIKAPAELRCLYPTEWAYRVSLDTDDIREANERAAKLRAEWLAKFAAQSRELSAQRAERISPELAQVLAQRVSARLLQNDEALRTHPERMQLLVGLDRALKPRGLTIGTRSPA